MVAFGWSRGISDGTGSSVDGQGSRSRTSSEEDLTRLAQESGSLDGSDAEYAEYRQKSSQWSNGKGQGARGDVSDVDTAKESKIRSTSFSSYPRFPRSRVGGRMWRLLSKEASPAFLQRAQQVWQLCQAQALQATILVLVVFTYAACPLAVSWAKVVGIDASDAAHPVPVKGRPFKESSVIVASWLLISLTGLMLSAIIGGRKDVVRCFDVHSMVKFAPAGVGWALADTCEVLAVSRIDPATYGVISQARLLGSAAACRALRGMRQTQLQWGVLCVLSFVCMAYCLVPEDAVPNGERLQRWRIARADLQVDWYFRISMSADDAARAGSYDNAVGVFLALMKVFLSVMSGVYGETCFKHSSLPGSPPPPELHVQMTQVSFSSTIAALIGYCFLCFTQGEDPTEFFSGPDGTWTLRTVAVAIVYCWREWICNLCVKRFDSVAKNICNAVALVVTYGFTVVVTAEKPFSPLKVILLLAVVAEVINYAATRRLPTPQAAPRCDRSSDEHPALGKGIPMKEYGALKPMKLAKSFESTLTRTQNPSEIKSWEA